MLKSEDESTRRKALREVISMCHPKRLGDNQIPEIGWERWNELIAITKQRAEEIESGTDEASPPPYRKSREQPN
jgi:hypothetical protein